VEEDLEEQEKETVYAESERDGEAMDKKWPSTALWWRLMSPAVLYYKSSTSLSKDFRRSDLGDDTLGQCTEHSDL